MYSSSFTKAGRGGSHAMVFFNRRPYERRSSEREVVNSNPGPPGPSTKVFKKSGEIMLAVKPLSQFG